MPLLVKKRRDGGDNHPHPSPLPPANMKNNNLSELEIQSSKIQILLKFEKLFFERNKKIPYRMQTSS